MCDLKQIIGTTKNETHKGSDITMFLGNKIKALLGSWVYSTLSQGAALAQDEREVSHERYQVRDTCNNKAGTSYSFS